MEGGIIEEIVSFYRHAAQGLEERKQVLYLLGPVGSAKSTLAIKLKSLMERYPIYTLVDGDTGERSPLLESPLGLFNPEKFGARWRGSTASAALPDGPVEPLGAEAHARAITAT
jgi:predicted Ser/Thr protein kinase